MRPDRYDPMAGFACIDRVPGLVLGWLDGTLSRHASRARIPSRAVRAVPAARREPGSGAAGRSNAADARGVFDFSARVRQRTAGPLAWLDVANWRAWTLGALPAAALLALILWQPLQADASSSMTAVLDYWGRGATSDREMQMILDPDTT